jgi:hypothetical protein
MGIRIAHHLARFCLAWAVAVAASPLLGRGLASTPEAQLQQQRIDNKVQQHQLELDQQRREREARDTPQIKAQRQRSFDSAGWDLGTTYTLAEGSWKGSWGATLGVGGRGSISRFEVSYLQWNRRVDGRGLSKSRVPIVVEWRIPLYRDLLWTEVGFEAVWSSREYLTATSYKDTASSMDLGMLAGLGLTQSLGEYLYLGANGYLHGDRRGSTKLGESPTGADARRFPVYVSFGLVLGFQSYKD